MVQSRSCQLVPWMVDGDEETSRELERWSTHYGSDGANAALDCLGFLGKMQLDGTQWTGANAKTGFPVVYFLPSIRLEDQQPIIYCAKIGAKGIIPLTGLVSTAAGAVEAAHKVALFRAKRWSSGCKTNRGEPFITMPSDYLDPDGDIERLLNALRKRG